MIYHLQSNSPSLRGVHLMCVTLALLVSSSIASGGSISSTHKNPSPQQQQQHLPKPQQQPQHQQSQSAELHQSMHQQNTNLQIRPHEQHERLTALPHLPTISSSNNDAANQEYAMKDVGVDEEMHDPYQYLNDLKVEPRLTAANSMPYTPSNQPLTHIPTMLTSFPYAPYNQFGNALSPPLATPRLVPFFSYPQPVLVPLPMYFAPTDLLYPGYTGTNSEIDESMSRAVGDQRAESSHFDSSPTSGSSTPTARNSQIFIMRFAPMPYMFMQGLGFSPAQPTLSALQPYTALPTFSPILNIPLNFMVNGKPTSIYQIGSTPNDFPNSVQFNNVNPFGIRPPATSSQQFSLAAANRPTATDIANSYSSHGSYGANTLPQPISNSLQQDSKMTLLKRPFFFNGRPDDIYTLPNNFNSLYSNSAYY
ncbi:protein transport protein SEC31 [Anastrepha obliqua]|uniref:protein transport protein SEC31 n=1 Tax=Anastrepha obliqua TaxID=95512 RepID=UPI002409B0BE|nr:protein transport protein SEC31 [Anastrepha obliqua]